MNKGIHTKPNDGISNEWLTPPHVIQSIGAFDLDPCAHSRQFYKTARRMVSLPDDGLEIEWRGRVWLNPPYGRALPAWMKRMAEHDNGVALVPARTEVESWFWPYVWEAATAVLFLQGRLYFHRPDGSTAGNAGHGSVLAAYGDECAGLLEDCKLSGRYIYLKDL